MGVRLSLLSLLNFGMPNAALVFWHGFRGFNGFSLFFPELVGCRTTTEEEGKESTCQLLARRKLPLGEFEKMILLTVRKLINWSTHLFTGMRLVSTINSGFSGTS